MLKIRLKPTGRKKRIFYRIVVSEEGDKRDGRVKDTLGWFNDKLNPVKLEVDWEKIKFWQERGAQITEAVKKLLEK